MAKTMKSMNLLKCYESTEELVLMNVDPVKMNSESKNYMICKQQQK